MSEVVLYATLFTKNQSFHQRRLAGAIWADQNSKRRKAEFCALGKCPEVAKSKAFHHWKNTMLYFCRRLQFATLEHQSRIRSTCRRPQTESSAVPAAGGSLVSGSVRTERSSERRSCGLWWATGHVVLCCPLRWGVLRLGPAVYGLKTKLRALREVSELFGFQTTPDVWPV